jgi:hypothetical protein
LVGLRRALHGARVPRTREWNPELAAVLPAELAGRVEEWVGRCAGRQRKFAELGGVLAAEQAAGLARLRRELDRPAFRRALSLAAPELSGELDRWSAGAGRVPKAQKVVRLAKYLARAAAKTSPYSTFMTAGLGGWSPAGSSPAGSSRDVPAARFHLPWEPVGVLDVDGAYLAAVRAGLARHPGLAAATRVRVNPSAAEVGGKVRFLGPPPAESIMAVGLTSAVRECLKLVRADGGCTLGALGERLALAGAAEPATAHRFVGRLVEVGLLEAVIPVSEHSLDVFGELERWVRAHAGGEMAEVPGPAGAASVAEVAGLVEAVHAELRRSVPVADVAGHRARIEALRRAAGELTDRLGVTDEARPRYDFDVLHETAVRPGGPVAACTLEQWRPALADLNVVRRLLALFDDGLPVRLALGSWARERFGAGARLPFLDFYQAVGEEVIRPERGPAGATAADLRVVLATRPWLPLSPGELHGDRLQVVDKLRAQAREAVLSQPSSGGVVRADPGALAAQMASWPEWVDAPGTAGLTSSGFYVQTWQPADGLHLVFNDTYGGHGQGRNRVRHLLSRAGADAGAGEDAGGREWEWRLPRPGPALAEWAGLLGMTLNLRVPSVPYEIDYPYTVSGRPACERLPLADLSVAHDPGVDLVSLSSERLGGPVVPLHLGMAASFALPPVVRFAEQAFSPTAAVHPSMQWLSPAGNQDSSREPAGPAEVTRHPRVQVGRVVVQRARWEVPAGLLPRRAAGEPDGAFLVRMAGWLREQAIPARAFVRARGGGTIAERIKSRKPVYFDAASPWLVAGFERQTRASGQVVFEEVLPAPEDALGHSPDEATVTEFLVEISDDGG